MCTQKAVIKRGFLRDLGAVAVLAVLCFGFWADCVAGGRVPVAGIYQQRMLPWAAQAPAGIQTRQWDSLLWDSVAQFYPWRLLLHRFALFGELPLWNPHQFCGYPFVGNGQSALFYPPNWLYFAVHPDVGMGLSAALHFFLGALFVYLLLRVIGAGRPAGFFAAFAFAFGGFTITWIELPTLVNSIVWLPAAWLGIELVFRRKAWGGGALTALALGMALLAGHFQIGAYVWLAALLYALIRLLYMFLSCRGRREVSYRLGVLAAAFTCGVLLASVQVLPTLELGGFSPRGAGSPSAEGFAFHQERAVPPAALLTLFAPDAFGSPVRGDYRGISYSEHCGFVGAITLLAGLLGLAAGRFGLRRHLLLFAGLAVLAMWAAMGGLPALALYWGVPKLGLAGGFSRLLSVWTVAAAVWCGLGLEMIIRRLRENRAQSETGNDVDGTSRRVPWATVIPVIALVLLVVQVLPWAWRFNPRIESELLYAETELVTQLRTLTGSERMVEVNDRGRWSLFETPAGVVCPPNAATVYGLHSVGGYDSLFPAAYRALAASLEEADPAPAANGNMLLMERGAPWAAIGARWVVAPHRWEPDGELHLAWEGEGVRLYRVDISQPGFADRLEVRETATGPDLPSHNVHAKITTDTGNRIVISLQADEDVTLILRDTFYPGWRAFADGQEVALSAYDDVFRTVRCAAGTRQVQMVYHPTTVITGGFLSLLGLTALCMAVTLGWMRRRAVR